MSRIRKIQFSQLLSIILAWQVVAFIIECYDHFLLKSSAVIQLTPNYSFLQNVVFNMGGALVGALLAGSFFVFYLNIKFRDKPYGYSILANCIVYIGIMSIVQLL